jgi:hypothetical protein
VSRGRETLLDVAPDLLQHGLYARHRRIVRLEKRGGALLQALQVFLGLRRGWLRHFFALCRCCSVGVYEPRSFKLQDSDFKTAAIVRSMLPSTDQATNRGARADEPTAHARESRRSLHTTERTTSQPWLRGRASARAADGAGGARPGAGAKFLAIVGPVCYLLCGVSRLERAANVGYYVASCASCCRRCALQPPLPARRRAACRRP